MKIAIDITTLFDQYSKRGIGTYTRNLVPNLITNAEKEGIEWHLLGFRNKARNLNALGISDSPNIHFHSLGPVKESTPYNLFFFRKKYIPILKRIEPDIYFSPNFERGFKVNKKWKNVIMVHDVIPLETNVFSRKSALHNFLKGKFYKYQFKKLNDVEQIITNSQYSKNRLIDFLPLDPEKIDAVPLGVSENLLHGRDFDPRRANTILRAHRISGKYILYYGGLEKNKNVASLVEAFKKLSLNYSDIKLVIIADDLKAKLSGKMVIESPEAKELYKLIAKFNLENKVILPGRVDEEHLRLIIQEALIFCHLSENEGFGLAALEAMSIGTPTMLSDIPAYRENFENGAVFVNANKPDQIKEKLVDLIQDPAFLAKLGERGKKIAETFTWERTAKKTLGVFNYVFNKENLSQRNVYRTKKIDFVAPFFYPFKGGAENYSFNIAKRLAREGAEVSALTSTFEDTNQSKETVREVKIKRAKTLADKYYLRFYPGLLPMVMSSKADIFHVQGFGFLWQDICLILKKAFSSKKKIFINTPHGPFMARKDYSGLQKFAKSAFTSLQKIYLNWLYDKVIAVNYNQSKWMSKEYGINLTKIKVLPIGISQSHFEVVDVLNTNEQKITEAISAKKCTVISFLGRFHSYKGVMDMLKAASKLKEEKQKFLIVLMGGDAGLLKEMNDFIKEYDLKDFVMIVERPSNALRNKILDISEIFVFPSQWEAYGIAMLEAMAHRNAVVSTKTEGGLYHIKNKKNGLLYKYGDVNDLTNHLIQLLNNKEMREKMKDLNYKKARELTWENLWEEYRSVYM